jgi:hypothetical protein
LFYFTDSLIALFIIDYKERLSAHGFYLLVVLTSMSFSKFQKYMVEDDGEEEMLAQVQASVAAWELLERDRVEKAGFLKDYRNDHTRKYFAAMSTLRGRDLFDAGLVSSIDEGKRLSIELRRNRTPLDWCRANAQRYMDQLNDTEFRGLFRMDKTLFQSMEEKVDAHFKEKNLYQRDGSRGGKPATPTRFLLAGTLRWLAGGSPHDITYFCGVRIRSFTRYRWDVLQALDDVYYAAEVKLPTTDEEREKLSKKFQTKCKMKGVLGAIDGLLVRINLPAGTKNARPYFCYKQFYALNLQGVAGPDGEFLYVNVGHAGATGDGCASRQSRFWHMCQQDEFHYSSGFFFLGDAAYSLMPWLMTPYEGAQEVNGTKDVYNNHVSMGRQVVERAFGMMIKRWRILAGSLEFSVVKCNKILRVCALLHNMCLRNSLSNKVTVDRRTAALRPFKQKDPITGVVEKVRLHVDQYRDPNVVITEAEWVAHLEKQWRSAAASKRALLTSRIYGKGNRRRVRRGAKRGAAYQTNK